VFFQVPVTQAAMGVGPTPEGGDDDGIEVQLTGHGGPIPIERPAAELALGVAESPPMQTRQRIRVEVR
jgi:hypothetical protein